MYVPCYNDNKSAQIDPKKKKFGYRKPWSCLIKVINTFWSQFHECLFSIFLSPQDGLILRIKVTTLQFDFGLIEKKKKTLLNGWLGWKTNNKIRTKFRCKNSKPSCSHFSFHFLFFKTNFLQKNLSNLKNIESILRIFKSIKKNSFFKISFH